MSAFYYVLYIFIAVVALLCITAFVMYICRLCTKSKDFDEEEFFTTRGRGMNLNSTETTQLMNETALNDPEAAGPSSSTNVALVNVRRKVEQYEHNNEAGHEAAPNASPVLPTAGPKKPPVAPRPLSTISKPSIAPKHGVIKPSNQPPPPPSSSTHAETAAVIPQPHKTVQKPKTAPPPPPPHEEVYEENTDSYNTKKRAAPQPPAAKPSSGRDSPPCYDDVMLDIPVDDYLTDNDN